MFESNSNPRSNCGSNQPYECLRCGATTMGENIDERNGLIKCIVCGYRVLKKRKIKFNPLLYSDKQGQIILGRNEKT